MKYNRLDIIQEKNVILQANYNIMAGFRDLIASPGYKTFMRKMLFYSVMIIIVGLVFLWRHWPGGDTMVILGGGVFVTWLIFFIIEKIISNQDN